MWGVERVARLMFKIWFGKGFSQEDAISINPELGPIVLTMFAFLCGNMLFSMMVSMMSSKFANVQRNAQQEYLFQRAVNTLEGVRADSVFCYVPPFNIPAVFILGPLSLILEPMTMHRLNVFCIRLCNFPILLAIAAYERYHFRKMRRAIRLTERGMHPKTVGTTSILGSFLGGESTVIRAAFDLAPPIKLDPPSTPTKDLERASAELKPPKPERPQGRTNANTLARLFNTTPKRGGGGGGGGGEVTVSADEWQAMLDSQKRLEDMIEKFMAFSGVDSGTMSAIKSKSPKKASKDEDKDEEA